MEAVPRLPMIHFDPKISPENVDFASKLKQLIASVGEDAASFEKEIKELETLRASSCIRVSETVEGVSTLKRYYCQLLFLKSRFKIGSDGPFQFSWRDIYSGTDYSVSDVVQELAAVMYNIGALHSRLGVGEDRQDSDGMKMAVAHFQCSAWAFHTLPDQFPQDSDSDLSSEVMAFKSQLCLAQAQECILEKSLLDCRKPGIVTKVCGQVVEYYKQALKQLEMSGAREMSDHVDSLLDIVGNRQSRSWRGLMDLKVFYYSSLSFLHGGLLSEEGGRWGERVAFYQGASSSLIQAGRVAKEYKLEQVYKGVMEALVYTSDVVNGKLEISKKENEFIYHEKVPDVDSLPTIKGASLVKGIPFDPSDPEVSGPDLFSRIVPMEAHEASSLYSEEQAKLLRTVCGEVEVANDSMVLYLSSMQLEDIPNPTSTPSLPQELVECAAGLSVRPQAVSQLQEAMAKLASVSADVEASLMEIQQMLKEEEVKEAEFQAVVGSRPRSIMAEMERETQKYHQAHSMASESNLTLHKAMQLHVTNLKLLARPIDELNANVPSLMEMDQKTQDSLEDMRRIMAKVDEMKSQRAKLEGELRAGVQNDDITESLARKGNVDQGKIFEKEMKKHDKTVQLIRQNIQAQGNIVRAMAERNAVYADARVKVEELMRKREEVIGSLVASYHAYEDLLNKTTKGLEFYDKLDVNVSKLLARVGGVVKVQEEERTQQMTSSAQKAADARALSLSLISGGYKPNFTPGAPPPDTPSSSPAPPAPTGGGRPKLSDYLAAKKSKTAPPTNPPPPPGIRPQPVGSEADPPHSSSGGYTTMTTPSSSLPHQHSYHTSMAQPAFSTHLPTHSHQVHGQGYQVPSHKMPIYQPSSGQGFTTQISGLGSSGQSIRNQQMPEQGIQGQQILGQASHGQQIPGEGIHGYQMQHPQQGIQGQNVPGQQESPQVSRQGIQGQHLPGQITQSQNMFGIGIQSNQISGKLQDQQRLAHGMHRMPGHIMEGPQMPILGLHNQYMPGQETLCQQFPGHGMQGQQATGQRMPSQQTHGHGLQGTQIHEQGMQGQQIHGQGMQGQLIPGQGTQGQQTHGQGTQGHQMPEHGTQGQQMHGQGMYGHQMHGQGRQGSLMPGHGKPPQQLSGQRMQHQPLPGQGMQGHQIPGQGMQGQQLPMQRMEHQQLPGQRMQPTPLPGQGIQGHQMPGQGMQGQQMPGQGMQGHQMPGQGVQPQQFSEQRMLQQPLPGQGMQGHQMPGQGMQGRQMPGQGIQGQQMPGQGMQGQQMPGQGMQGQQMPLQRMQHQQLPGQGMQGHQMTGPGMKGHFNMQGIQTNLPTPQIMPTHHTSLPTTHQTTLPTTHQTTLPTTHQTSLPTTHRTTLPTPQTVIPTPKTALPNPQTALPSTAVNIESTNLYLLSSLSLSPAPVVTSSPPPRPRPAVPMPGTTTTTLPVQPPPQLSEDDRVSRLSQEVERLQNLVSNLSSKTLGGQSPLEAKWKEVVAMVESNKSKHSVSVARCYPSKNRVPDVLPYDHNRLLLKNVKDDYINASRISGPGEAGYVSIITQAPASKTMGEFWTMVWQEGVETMVCLVLGQVAYIPRDKTSMEVDGFTISMKSSKSHPTFVERVINITNSTSKQTRALVQLEMVGWPGPDLPPSPACLLDTAVATQGLRRQQRVPSRPVLVHCLDGGSKSATFLTILWLVEEMESPSGVQVPPGQGWPDVSAKLGHLIMQRKGVVRDKQYLKLVYESLLYYMQDNLMKQGILNTGSTIVLGGKKGHSRHPSQDFVGLTVATLTKELNKVDPVDIDIKMEDNFVKKVEDDDGSNDAKGISSNPLVDVKEESTDVVKDEEATPAGSGVLVLKNIPDDLSKLADITESQTKKTKKITKDDFANSTGQVGKVDESDPLSQLDPLWYNK